MSKTVLAEDPDEITNQYGNPEYADVIADRKVDLERLRQEYDSDVGVMPEEWRRGFRE